MAPVPLPAVERVTFLLLMVKCYHLTLTLPEEKPKAFTLAAERILLGRGDESRIPMEVSSVSTRHCELEKVPEGYLIRDLGSKNGTLLNGQPVSDEPILLSHGDRLVLGELVKLRFTESTEIGDDRPRARVSAENGPRVRLRKAELPPMVNPVAAAVAAATQRLKK